MASLRLHDHLLPPRHGGSSQSMIQRFPAEIDPELAREPYLRCRELFVVSPLGVSLPASR